MLERVLEYSTDSALHCSLKEGSKLMQQNWRYCLFYPRYSFSLSKPYSYISHWAQTWVCYASSSPCSFKLLTCSRVEQLSSGFKPLESLKELQD